ncbi:hypothetical protein C5167_040966 [Papaver somniferum]|uniref:Alcohol dehydrogenase-like N-terminal domain-containing protein n=1 Tax=Papaver somniferum TaxID=3469 RepID=A0A4Y7IJX4_PAPSO|nr:hypothetical protein C5167_040966 [Papaver somniferum]
MSANVTYQATTVNLYGTLKIFLRNSPNKRNSKHFFATLAVTKSAEMVKTIRVHEFGGPEVLKWEDVEVGEPKDGEIRVRNKAIGINFIDVYFRKGLYYKAATMPFVPGMEAVGVVTAVGPRLTGRKVGDVVAYYGQPMGSYAEEQILPANAAVTVPPSIDPKIAASVLLKGMTAQMLVRRSFKFRNSYLAVLRI